jgi:excisionase family DNA binding protein
MDFQQNGTAVIPRLALTPDEAAACTGFSRSRIYEALASGALTARKNGKATVIELVELQRWLSTLPTRGRRPTMVEAGASAA